ncbi:trigger factor [Amphibiibacter pelophylacis]|uniref:Trigger factor n=1 Tax=Amphibiibacter pelophylacis TaxID=1799477 RepID=A0ACC6NYM9_9BURK
MTVAVETLEKLQRRVTLTLSPQAVSAEVDKRLKKLARTVKADGFRPGKVPMSVVNQRFGYSVQYEVLNDQLGAAFDQTAREAGLRVAGAPDIAPVEGQKAEDQAAGMQFHATFEVYPEITLGDLSAVAVDKVSAEVNDGAIDRTVGILRAQRRTFSQRAASVATEAGDRVTIDFEGKIDGEPFAGGAAQDFQFIVGEGQMLEQFDQAVRGMKVGESKTFPLQFPEDYHGKDVAGKEADFLVTVKKLEQQHLPEVDDAFAQSLNVADGTVDGLRADIRKNLEREVKFRVLARNKAAAMDALLKVVDFDLPSALVKGEAQRMGEQMRADLKARGMKDADKMPIPEDAFTEQAERRVRLGLAVGELVRQHSLQAKPEQLRAHLDEIAQSYEKPAEVVQWYLGDRQRMGEVEAVVLENNVAQWILSQVQVTDKAVGFEELMQQA